MRKVEEMHDGPSGIETRTLRGGPIAAALRDDIAGRAAALAAEGRAPKLCVVVAGDDPAAHAYAQSKGRTAAKLAIGYEVVSVAPTAGQAGLIAAVDRLNADPAVHGILIDLPVAPGMDAEAALDRIDRLKDVDGLTAGNIGLVQLNRESEAIVPATPAACIRLAEEAGPLAGRRVTVVGRGRSVGRALAPMLVNRDATVTVCHSRTRDLPDALRTAEVVFVAAGRAGLIGASDLQPGQVVIDAGINMVDGGIVGDVDPAGLDGRVAAFTPVPGGVGPLTSTLIFANLLRAMALQTGGGAVADAAKEATA